MLRDGLVHEWLRVTRVITFVMPKAAITNEVDDHVFVKLLAIVVGKFCHAHTCFRVVTVHMENGCLYRFGNIT